MIAPLLTVIGVIAPLVTAGAQGFVVFSTATTAYRALKLQSLWAKPLIVFLSWAVWAVMAFFIYSLLGGGGAMMEGAGLLVVLTALSFLGSFAFAVGWFVVSRRNLLQEAQS